MFFRTGPQTGGRSTPPPKKKTAASVRKRRNVLFPRLSIEPGYKQPPVYLVVNSVMIVARIHGAQPVEWGMFRHRQVRFVADSV